MSDPRIENLAKILVNYSVKVKPGDWVVVNANTVAHPLTVEVVRAVLRSGGYPTILTDSDETQEVILTEASDEQLQYVTPLENLIYEKMDVLISLRAASNTRTMTGVDPKKQQTRQKARRKLMETYLQRSAEGSLRWILTNFPCQAYAQEADMSLSDYENFVYSATFADQENPVESWQKFYNQQEEIIQWLKGKKQVVLKGPNVDLSLSIEGRKFVNCAGENNMPDGEIFTGPIEASANGWVRFTYPAITGGREVDGVQLRFEDGKVIEASASKNESFLLSQIDSDPGARYIGEFAIGTNYGIQRFTKSILFDEKIGGSFHLALGAGLPETGSLNKSSIHWDFICDMKQDSQIIVDGELLYKNGKFQV
ncbi:MAG TPA: aminopeptidase [Anaerolineales bacterium]|nr:aminopeptidase [Anaerolineales bacterium]